MFSSYLNTLQVVIASTPNMGHRHEYARAYNLRHLRGQIQYRDYSSVLPTILEYLNSGITVTDFEPKNLKYKDLLGRKLKKEDEKEFKFHADMLMDGIVDYENNPVPNSIGLKKLLETTPRHVIAEAITYATKHDCELSKKAIEHDAAFYLKQLFKEFSAQPVDIDLSRIKEEFLPEEGKRAYKGESYSPTELIVARSKHILNDLANLCDTSLIHGQRLGTDNRLLEVTQGSGNEYASPFTVNKKHTSSRQKALTEIDSRLNELVKELIATIAGSKMKATSPVIGEIVKQARENGLDSATVELFTEYLQRKERLKTPYNSMNEIAQNSVAYHYQDDSNNPVEQAAKYMLEKYGAEFGYPLPHSRSTTQDEYYHLKSDYIYSTVLVISDLNKPGKAELLVEFVEQSVNYFLADILQKSGLAAIILDEEVETSPEQRAMTAKILCKKFVPEVPTAKTRIDFNTALHLGPYIEKMEKDMPRTIPDYMQPIFAKAFCDLLSVEHKAFCTPPTAIAESSASPTKSTPALPGRAQ